jgi:hypothetical protein
MFEISSMLRKKTPKSIKNHRKIDVWGSLGAILRPLGQHLGHIFPEDWILEAFGRVLVAQDVQLDSKLEAQEAPKSSPKAEKIDVEKQHVFGIDFGRLRTSFWEGFW